MKLSAPKALVFWICFVLIVLGVVAHFVTIPFVSANVFWFLTVGGVLLLLACMFKGL